MELVFVDSHLAGRLRVGEDGLDLVWRAKFVELSLHDEDRTGDLGYVLAQIMQVCLAVESSFRLLPRHVHVIALEVRLCVFEFGEEIWIPLSGETPCRLNAVLVAGFPDSRTRRPVRAGAHAEG